MSLRNRTRFSFFKALKRDLLLGLGLSAVHSVRSTSDLTAKALCKGISQSQ